MDDISSAADAAFVARDLRFSTSTSVSVSVSDESSEDSVSDSVSFSMTAAVPGWSNTRRCEMPVLVEIHSSDVSTCVSRSTLVMTVLGAAEPMPARRQLSGPVVTMDKDDDDDACECGDDDLDVLLCAAVGIENGDGDDDDDDECDCDCARKDVGWNANDELAMESKKVASRDDEESLILM